MSHAARAVSRDVAESEFADFSSASVFDMALRASATGSAFRRYYGQMAITAMMAIDVCPAGRAMRRGRRGQAAREAEKFRAEA